MKGRKRKSAPIHAATLEHANTVTSFGVAEPINPSSIQTPNANENNRNTCHEAFVTAANAVGQLYQAVQNSKEQGARAALIKLYECLPSNDDEVMSVGDLKRYLVNELNSFNECSDREGSM